MTKLLALIDGSIYSRSVCDHAAWVARRTSASVELLHVLGRRDVSSAPVDLSGNLDIDARDVLLAELVSLDAQKAKLAQKRGRVILEEAKSRLLEAEVSEVTARLRNGDLVETVRELEEDADLIVIGKRGEAADFARLHLGSNLERVVRSSRKPVLVAARAFKPPKRFLVAFDGGASVTKAIDYAAASPIFAEMDCHLVTVGSDTPENRQRLEQAAQRLRDAGYRVETDLRAGDPDAQIAQVVEQQGIDLLVMGAYGHSRIRNLIIGSTTTEMIRSCLIPVVLFR